MNKKEIRTEINCSLPKKKLLPRREEASKFAVRDSRFVRLFSHGL